MPPEILGIVAVCATVAIVAISRIFSRHLDVRHERRQQRPEPEVADRLARIEIAIETMSVEVERISEANRFMAKLLAERPGAGIPTTKPPAHVITPH